MKKNELKWNDFSYVHAYLKSHYNCIVARTMEKTNLSRHHYLLSITNQFLWVFLSTYFLFVRCFILSIFLL